MMVAQSNDIVLHNAMTGEMNNYESLYNTLELE